ncbi:MAG: hypothetical protein IJ747_03920 [Lachnospiraceae bacterium]|nr:hypothetical protein [Lachnospiraceae bacterium]
MIDWEDVLNATDEDDLKDVKTWLFQENMRLQQEKASLALEREDVAKEKQNLDAALDKFNTERSNFKDEMNLLNHRSAMERQRLKEEKVFFEKKLSILQNGFLQLDLDRKRLERERLLFENERDSFYHGRSGMNFFGDGSDVVGLLFRNATNPLTLRKRYKDLMKIFHPDNIAGDEELVQMINKEFSRRKREEA